MLIPIRVNTLSEFEGTFDDLDLSRPTRQAVAKAGYEKPSPIQAQFIPIAITGKDCTGQARTGTGKTVAFIIPILEQTNLKDDGVQAIVLAPTRELCEQVGTESRKLVPSRDDVAVIVGGKSMRDQQNALNRGASIVIGTPGRVIDMIQRRLLRLDAVKIVVLDEADRMLDIGFRPDIERILRKCPQERQTLLLSATMPPEVERLANRYMNSPDRVDLSQDQVAVDTVDQFFCTVDEDRKLGLLVAVLRQEKPKQVLVFTRTKRRADQLYEKFSGRLSNVALIHGDLPQRKRDKVMRDFRSGKVRMLIATDVVGRGIDVSTVSHIINYDVPEYCDDYVHRVGRTGRLSSSGKGHAVTFVTREQGNQLTSIEQRINCLLPEYVAKKFEAFRPTGPRPTVEDSVRKWEEPEEEFAIMLD